MPYHNAYLYVLALLVLIALYLYWQAPRYARPFLLVSGIIGAQQFLYETLGRLEGWAWLFSRIADVNLPLLLTLTGIASLGTAWHGWVAGARPMASSAAAAA